MARVLGIGGVFFKCRDPDSLKEWYRRWLEVPVAADFSGAAFQPQLIPDGGYTVWGLFGKDTEYFSPGEREFMLNFMVDDLEGALARVREGGAEIIGAIEESEFGRFGWFLDPDGNKVELWVPPASQ